MSSNGSALLRRVASRPVLIGAGVLALLLVGARAMRPKGGEAAMRAVDVARRNLVVSRTATGEVKPRNRVEVKPPIAGRIEQVLVKEGDEVSQGQLVAWMSSAERAALLDAARSQGEEAVTRWEQIYKPAPLLAPLAGTVIVRAVEPGQTVATDNPVVVIADHLIIKAQVDETDVGHIKAGQRAEITLDAYPNDAIAGQVEHVAYEAEIVNNVTIYRVDVLPEQVPEFMRSGMTANVSIIVAERPGVLAVPVDAIRQDGEGASVLARPAGVFGRASRKTVTTGLSDGKWIEVVSGLSEGDTIMVALLRLPKSSQQPRSPLSPFRQRQRPSTRQ